MLERQTLNLVVAGSSPAVPFCHLELSGGCGFDSPRMTFVNGSNKINFMGDEIKTFTALNSFRGVRVAHETLNLTAPVRIRSETFVIFCGKNPLVFGGKTLWFL